ncbi:MAG: prepilin-type N-terminal cleavage/methylation domain-containing protein [Planctomycetota bacterium]
MERLTIHHSDQHTRRWPRGFTLVEILIVVVIIAVLAAIVIPQFSNASETSKQNALRSNMFQLRQQIELYKVDHDGVPPTLADFIDQMTLSTNTAGDTAAIGTPGYPHGPYLNQMPPNPFTDTVPLGSGSVGSSAWWYDETTGDIAPNDSSTHRNW